MHHASEAAAGKANPCVGIQRRLNQGVFTTLNMSDIPKMTRGDCWPIPVSLFPLLCSVFGNLRDYATAINSGLVHRDILANEPRVVQLGIEAAKQTRCK
jgi:hypothetical protein